MRRSYAHLFHLPDEGLQLGGRLEFSRLPDDRCLVRLKTFFAALVRRRDVDRLQGDRRRTPVTGRLEQLTQLDVDPGFRRGAVVDQNGIAGQQVVLVQGRGVGVASVERREHHLQPLGKQMIFQFVR